jgi:DNA mismatch repair protein MutL
MTIFRLDSDLIAKIAAGEVIENPSSVVKELLENSIDAGAKNIEIDLKKSGKMMIRIRDDGSGIESDDLEVAVDRHTTSKIMTKDDLYSIHTLGFRGEALASISSVSRMRILSRTRSDEVGGELIVHGGDVKRKKRAGCNPGTLIEVNDLFYNLPARRKHMKTDHTELEKIIRLVTTYSIVYPDISLKLSNNGKEILFLPSSKDPLKNISSVFGAEVGRNLEKIHHEEGGIEVSGFVSKSSYNVKNRNLQYLFVNSRNVVDRGLFNPVYDALHTFLPVGRHPVIALNIMVDPRTIDQNIHPQKKRVSFENRKPVEDAIRKSVESMVAVNNPVHELSSKQQDSLLSKNPQKEEQAEPTGDRNPFGKHHEEGHDADRFAADSERQEYLGTAEEKSSETKKKHDKQSFRIVGQIKKTYVIVETPEGMLIVDQHAACERVNYERFMEQYRSGNIQTQSLVSAEVLELSPAHYSAYQNAREFFGRTGFEIQDFGQNSVVIRGYPVVIGRSFYREDFLDMLFEIAEGRDEFLKKKEEFIIRKACRASVKKNDRLEMAELSRLISDLLSCRQPNTCPHGRPTMICMTENELEKMFKRKM